MAIRTPGAVRGRLLACLEYSGGYQHQRCVRHLPLGLGLLNLARLHRRHRVDRVLRRILDPPPWCAAGTPVRSAFCAHGARCLCSLRVRHPQRPPRPPPAWSPSSWGRASVQYRLCFDGQKPPDGLCANEALAVAALGLKTYGGGGRTVLGCAVPREQTVVIVPDRRPPYAVVRPPGRVALARCRGRFDHVAARLLARQWLSRHAAWTQLPCFAIVELNGIETSSGGRQWFSKACSRSTAIWC